MAAAHPNETIEGKKVKWNAHLHQVLNGLIQHVENPDRLRVFDGHLVGILSASLRLRFLLLLLTLMLFPVKEVLGFPSD